MANSDVINVLDAFGGVGGNTIQFALACGFCVGVDNDKVKVECMKQNARVYDLEENRQFQIIERDFLRLESYKEITEAADEVKSGLIRFPSGNKQFNAAFLSPPWGGLGYEQLDEYTLEHIFPEFDCIIDKATDYTANLMIFLPRNTSISDLVRRLCKFQNKLLGDLRKTQIEYQSGNQDVGELSIEIEQLIIKQSCKALVVYTGDLARIQPKHVAKSFLDS